MTINSYVVSGQNPLLVVSQAAVPVVNVLANGATGNGITDDGPAIVAADAQAAAAGYDLYFPSGTYLMSGNRTLASNVVRGLGGVFACAGALTFSGNFTAPPLQQCFQSTSVVVFASGSVREIWTNWWGALPTGTPSTNTTSFQSALNCYMTSLYTGNNNCTIAPELRTGPGNHQVTTPSASSRAPILTVNRATGGVWRGCGMGQTNIQATGFTNLQSPPAVLRRINCQFFEVRDMGFIANTGAERGIASAVKPGDTTVTVDSAAGMTFPLRVTLTKKNPIPIYFETLNAVSAIGNVVTLDRPVRFDYAAGPVGADGTRNFMNHSPVASVEDWADVTDPLFVTPPAGLSAQLPSSNRLTNVLLGAGSDTGTDQGHAINCHGGSGSASDANNDNHVDTNVVVQNPNVCGVYIGHRNAINTTIDNCVLSQGSAFWSVLAPDGGTVTARNTTMIAAWGLLGMGGVNAHAHTITGGLSESQCPSLMADPYIPNRDFVTASFVQPAVGSTVTVAVTSSSWLFGTYVAAGRGGFYSATIVDGTHLSLKNLGCPENASPTTTIPAGTNIGHAFTNGIVSMLPFDGQNVPQSAPVIASAASGTNTLTLSATDAALLTGLRSGLPISISNADGTGLEKNWVADAASGGGPAWNWSTKVLTLRNNLSNNHTTNAGGIFGYVSASYQFDVQGSYPNVLIGASSQGGGASNVPGLEVRISDIALLPSAQQTGVMTLMGIPFLGSVGYTVDNAILNILGAGFTASAAARANLTNGGRVGAGFAMAQPTSPTVGSRSVGTWVGVDRLTSAQGYVELTDGVLKLDTATGPGIPIAGGYLYVDVSDSKLKFRGDGGTITTLANP